MPIDIVVGPKWKRALASAAALAVVLGGALLHSCGSPVEPDLGGAGRRPASVSLRLALSSAAIEGLNARLRAFYRRLDQSTVDLGVIELPLQDIPTQQVRFPLDLGPCLADPQRSPAGPDCQVLVEIILRRDDTEIDRQQVGPLALRTGQSSTPVEVPALIEVTGVTVTPSTAQLRINEEVTLTAALRDAQQRPVTGRQPVWTTSNAAVATVTAAGVVRAVTAGTATITATSGAATGTAAITVQSAPQIALVPAAGVSFSAVQNTPLPAEQTVQVTNAGQVPLTGLALGSITYGQPVAAWLTATLSAPNAPAVLTLRPSRTDLAPGVYTASVPVTSPVATNSPQALTVSYIVGGGPSIALGVTAVTASAQEGQNAAAQNVSVTNGGGGGAAALTSLTATTAYDQGQPTGWLQATLTQATSPSSLALAFSSASLAPGTYGATITVSSPVATTGPQTVRVTLAVGQAPRIQVGSPTPVTTVNAAVTQGQSPAPFSAPVANVGGGGAAALTGLGATVSYAQGQPTGWLTADVAPATSPASLTLTYATASLAPGSYTATVQVSSGPAINSPASVTVNLTVASAQRVLTIGRDGAAISPATSVRVTSAPAGIDCTLAGLQLNGTCQAPFDNGTQVTLTAVGATPGDLFMGWTDPACAAAVNGPCTITLTANTNAVARTHGVTYSGTVSHVWVGSAAGNEWNRAANWRNAQGQSVVPTAADNGVFIPGDALRQPTVTANTDVFHFEQELGSSLTVPANVTIGVGADLLGNGVSISGGGRVFFFNRPTQPSSSARLAGGSLAGVTVTVARPNVIFSGSPTMGALVIAGGQQTSNSLVIANDAGVLTTGPVTMNQDRALLIQSGGTWAVNGDVSFAPGANTTQYVVQLTGGNLNIAGNLTVDNANTATPIIIGNAPHRTALTAGAARTLRMNVQLRDQNEAPLNWLGGLTTGNGTDIILATDAQLGGELVTFGGTIRSTTTPRTLFVGSPQQSGAPVNVAGLTLQNVSLFADLWRAVDWVKLDDVVFTGHVAGAYVPLRVRHRLFDVFDKVVNRPSFEAIAPNAPAGVNYVQAGCGDCTFTLTLANATVGGAAATTAVYARSVNFPAESGQVIWNPPGAPQLRTLQLTAGAGNSGFAVVSGGGLACTVSGQVTAGTCSAQVLEGTVLTLSAAASDGTRDALIGLSGGPCGTLTLGTSCSFTMPFGGNTAVAMHGRRVAVGEKVWKSGDPGNPRAWNLAGNWGPVSGAPTATTNVVVPAVPGLAAPEIAAAASAANLTVEPTVQVSFTLATTLSVCGSVSAAGATIAGASGTVSLGWCPTSPAARSVSGSLSVGTVVVGDSLSAANLTLLATGGVVNIVGNATAAEAGWLTLPASASVSAGAVNMSGQNARLTLATGATLSVNGNFSYAQATGSLFTNNGTLRVSGNLSATVPQFFSGNYFVNNAGSTIALNGSGSQLLNINAQNTYYSVQDLELAGPGGQTVSLATDLDIRGKLTVNGQAMTSSDANQRTLTVGSNGSFGLASVQNATFTRVSLNLQVQTASSVQAFNNVTFAGHRTTGATPLSINYQLTDLATLTLGRVNFDDLLGQLAPGQGGPRYLLVSVPFGNNRLTAIENTNVVTDCGARFSDAVARTTRVNSAPVSWFACPG